jgi:hypothetical protein
MSRSLSPYRTWVSRLGAALGAVIVMPQAAWAQASSTRVFQQSFDLTRLDIMALEGRRIVSRILKTEDAREVAVIGAVHVNVPMDVLAEYYRDVETFFAGDKLIVQVGSFAASPAAMDFQGLKLRAEDIKSLRKCRIGRCKVKLTRRQIERLRTRVDWSDSNHAQQVSDELAHSLVATLTAYRSEGNEALPVYHDKETPLNSAEDFRALLTVSGRFLGHDPGLYRYLQDFPDAQVPDIEDFYYWTVEDFGLKPVTSVNHMMVSRRPASGLPYTTIAIKQIYASHYLQSLIRLATLTPASDRYPLHGTYIVLHAHLRFDDRVGGIKRGLLERQLEHTWAMHMKSLRKRAEERYRLQLTSRKDG